MAGRRLTVLIAFRDHRRAERLAEALAAEADLLPVLDEGAGEQHEAADAIVTDGEVTSSDLPDATAPLVVLSSRPEQSERHGAVSAVLPETANDLLIAAAIRLATAGYRVSRTRRYGGENEGFHGEDDLPGDADPGELDEGEEGSLTDHATGNGDNKPVLSPRERQVLSLLTEGAPNKVIARRLDISVHTAKFHVAAILVKLGAVNRTDAIAIAMRQGLVLV